MPRAITAFLFRGLVAAASSGTAVTSPSQAQDQAYRVVVDGRERELVLPRLLRDCEPAGDEEEIVICARRGESERYRLPRQAWDPNGPVASVSRERHQLYEQGDSRIGSCSTVGPGGWTGCAHRAWKAAREQHNR